jgi:hypothetical protein
MERAARAFQKHKLSKPLLTDEEVLRAVWSAAVGKIISRHTSRVRLVRTTLVVEVEDAIWQRQLNGLRRQILDQVRKTTGNSRLENLEFRIAVPRRQAQRALSACESPTSTVTSGPRPAPFSPSESTPVKPLAPSFRAGETLRGPAATMRNFGTKTSPNGQSTIWSGEPAADEADQIHDPVLKKVYQLSRRKASA